MRDLMGQRLNFCRTEEDKGSAGTEETGRDPLAKSGSGGWGGRVFNTSKSQLHPDLWVNHTFSDFKQCISVCDLKISHSRPFPLGRKEHSKQRKQY